ncbi:hypothetical protein L7F22_002529 [Adiantum nelumboides]|nr:hypothetical protein [Adiantum nelumboides]
MEGLMQQLTVAGALAIVALLGTIWAVRRQRRAHGRREGTEFPPGPPAWPILGHLPLLWVRPHQVLADLCLKQGYGPIMGLRLGSHKGVVVSSAAMAKELLLTHDKAFANRVPYLFTNALLYGYDTSVGFSSYNPRWAAMRKMYTLELLSAKRLDDLRHVRQEELSNLLYRLRDRASMTCNSLARGGSHSTAALIDVGAFLGDMIANTVARMVHSQTLAEDVGAELQSLLRALEHVGFPTLGDFLPCLRFMDALPKRRMKQLHRRIDKILDSIISQRMSLMAQCAPHQLPNDFLQVIISKGSTGDHVDNGFVTTTLEMKAITLDILAGGIHTSTATLEWAIAELFQNPECLHKLQLEIDLLTKDRRDIIMDEDVQLLPYLKNIVKEVLRLHPIAPLLLPRVSSIECKVGNYTLPKGTQAFVNVWAISRDALIWENPESFYPERFKGSERDVWGLHYDLLPFGSGRRMCPGIRLGISSVQVTLANLVKFFDWDLPHGQSPSAVDMTEKPFLVTRSQPRGSPGRGNLGATSSNPHGRGKLLDKGKRPIDAKDFQTVTARKSYKPRQVFSRYASPTIFDILHDIPSPNTVAGLEDACHTAEKAKYPTNTPAKNLEVNMENNDEDSLKAGNTQIVLNTPQ